MHSKYPPISIVWLKRDLRLEDHEALCSALNSNNKVLLLYVAENTLKKNSHFSERHLNFIRESLRDINTKLNKMNTEILAVEGELISVFEELKKIFFIKGVYSHFETGIRLTFERDLDFKKWVTSEQIKWYEYRQQGVFRGLKNRDNWSELWENFMRQPQKKIPKNGNFLNKAVISKISTNFKLLNLNTRFNSKIQIGGSSEANRYLETFFNGRYLNYQKHISKPDLSRKSCSRLSPYISYGNISMRQVIQRTEKEKKKGKNGFGIRAFQSRLRWQSHFIQKFEMECDMEFKSINKGYHKIIKTLNYKYIDAWEKGKTGIPLVDASMRCLVQTGYLNFRMRALVVSFFVHHLWQPWQACSAFLAKQFLDFEPGIHFPQIQMQAGETGINTLRIYNPVKNGLEHDPFGNFTKQWIPELRVLPEKLVHTPWNLTPLETEIYNFKIGYNYPTPIVDTEKSRKFASETLWQIQKKSTVQEESKRILKQHTFNEKR